jgi:hypothetical protein
MAGCWFYNPTQEERDQLYNLGWTFDGNEFSLGAQSHTYSEWFNVDEKDFTLQLHDATVNLFKTRNLHGAIFPDEGRCKHCGQKRCYRNE